MFFDISLLLETNKVTGGFVAPLFFQNSHELGNMTSFKRIDGDWLITSELNSPGAGAG